MQDPCRHGRAVDARISFAVKVQLRWWLNRGEIRQRLGRCPQNLFERVKVAGLGQHKFCFMDVAFCDRADPFLLKVTPMRLVHTAAMVQILMLHFVKA